MYAVFLIFAVKLGMATPQSVSFYTLGCKLNYSETSAIGRMFEDRGYAVNKFEDGADICVINTCSVTEFADRKCKKIVRQAQKANAQAKIVVVGCYAQLKPKEIAEIPGVDLVLGAAEKFRILDFVDDLQKAEDTGAMQVSEVQHANSFVSAFSFGDRTRSFLKVQDGCDYKCTFCTIPLARGKSRSDTIQNIVEKAHEIVAKGVKEIVLTGVNIGDFGNGTAVIEGTKPKKGEMFIDLIKALDEVEGVERYRISSIEPNLCTDEIISFVSQSKRIVPHFHMPLQSGSNKMLALMKRRYRRELYQERVAQIKTLMPHCCIGVDVIVGFPGETEEDFLDTYNFLLDLDISYLHVFTYSERKNTPAAEMENPVPLQIRRERNTMLTTLSEKKKRAFYAQFAGQERTVLFEAHKNGAFLSGFTDNYIKVELPYQADMVNTIGRIKLDKLSEATLFEASMV